MGPVQAHRDNLGAGLVRHHSGALEHLHQGAGDGDAALREDDQFSTALDHVDQGAGGERVGGVDGDGASQGEEIFEHPFLGHDGVDGEGEVFRDIGGDQGGV